METKKKIDLLEFLYTRLRDEYKENPNYDYMNGLKTVIDDFKAGQVKVEVCATIVKVQELEYKYFLYFNSSTIEGKRGEGNIVYESSKKITNQDDIINAQKHIEKILYNIQGVAVKPGSVTIKNITLLDG